MTIAKAINDIAAAQGGTPAKPATIAGAIDALNDALAGSDQKAARTIEDAVVLLGEHIGGGGGGGTYDVKCYEKDGQSATETNSFVYLAEWSNNAWVPVEGTSHIDEAESGVVLIVDSAVEYQNIMVLSTVDFTSPDFCSYALDENSWFFVMPKNNVCVLGM